MTGSVSVELDKLNWNPSAVQVPEAQSVPAGPDPVSTMLSAYLPTVHTDVETAVEAAKAQDQSMAEKVSAAKSHYQVSDEQGHQSIQRARQQGALADQDFVHTSGSSVGGGGDQMGSLMGILGQLMQVPQQAAQAVGSASQSMMQTGQQVAQQVSQMAGQSGKDDADKQGQGSGAAALGGLAAAGGAVGNAVANAVGQGAGAEKRPEDGKGEVDDRANSDEKPKAEDQAKSAGRADAPQSAEKSTPPQASSGKHASELAPVTPLPESRSPGRHAADPAVDV